MDWIRTDVFCFRFQHPNYIEEEHLMVMGHRDDSRVYYAMIAIPERPDERVEAYKELKAKFNSYLKEEATSKSFTAIDYGLLVEDTIRKYKGFVLDSFPDGE
jgi:hypothetical protein